MRGEFSKVAKDIIWQRAGGRCERCGRGLMSAGGGYSYQHRKARGMGGTADPAKGDPSNGALMCGSGTTGCHGWVESRPVLAAMEGFRVESAAVPAEVPLLLHGKTWVYLDDEPTYRKAIARMP